MHMACFVLFPIWLAVACTSTSADKDKESEVVDENSANAENNYGNNQGYNNQSYNNQAYNAQGYNDQGYNNQGYNNQGYNNQGYNNQGYNNQGYNDQASGQSYDGTSGTTANYPSNNAGQYQDYQGNNNFDATATAPVTNQSLMENEGYVVEEENNIAYAANNGQTYNVAPNLEDGSAEINTAESETTSSLDATAVEQGHEESSDTMPMIISDSRGDVLPMVAELSWVGYDYRPEEAVVRVEMITKGAPKYALFRTENQHKQFELVVRLYQTRFGGRVSRDIDASEFPTPVSYIRVFRHYTEQSSDVIITLRELPSIRLYAKEGNLLMTFGIPDKYYGNQSVQPLKLEYAENMAEDSEAYVEFFVASDLPKGTSPLDVSDGVFETVGSMDGLQIYDVVSNNALNYSSQGLPEQNFNNIPVIEQEQRYNYNNAPNSSPPSQPSNGSSQSYRHIPYQGSCDTRFCGKNQAKLYPGLWVQRSGILGAIAQNNAAPQNDNNPYYGANNANAGNAGATNPSENLFGNNAAGTGYEGSNNAAQSQSANATANYSSDYVDVSSEEEAGYDNKEVAVGSSMQDEPIQPVTLEFQDAKLTDVLKILAAENNLNFIYDHQKYSSQRVSMSLKNVSWQVALDAVLNLHGLGFSPIGGKNSRVIKIDQAAQAVVKPKGTIGPDRELLLIRLSYIEAEEANTIVQTFIQDASSGATGGTGGGSGAGGGGGGGAGGAAATASSGSVPESVFKSAVDQRTNTLIIEAIPSILSRVKALIERLDTQTPQVQITARIVEVQKSSTDSFGISWGKAFNASAATGVDLGALGIAGVNGDFAVQAPSNQGVASLGFSLDTLTSVNAIKMALEWQETHANARILQDTSVTVLDNNTASIESGFQDTITYGGGSGGQGGTKDISYTLSLQVTPQVTSDGSVNLEVSVQSDDPVDNAGTNRKATKSVTTNLIRASGETAAIAGVYTHTESSGSQNVPLFSHIPIIGWLFKQAEDSRVKREIVIFITPTIINLTSLSNNGTLASNENYNNYNYNNYQNSGENNYSYDQNVNANYSYNQNTNANYSYNQNAGYNNSQSTNEESNYNQSNEYGYEDEGGYDSESNEYDDYYSNSYNEDNFSNNSSNQNDSGNQGNNYSYEQGADQGYSDDSNNSSEYNNSEYENY